MIDSSRPSIQIDLNEFKLHLYFKSRTKLTLHFNSPSRKFYLSLIAFVVNEMKKSGKMKSVPMAEHLDLLGLLNETVGGAAGSSDRENLLHRIYTKWKDSLPNLEEAPLFKVLGRKKEEGDGGKAYSFGDLEKDGWANLFDYIGSEENVRLKFATDKIGISLDETSIIFGDSVNGEAWGRFISSLEKDLKEEKEVLEAVKENIGKAVPEPPEVSLPRPQERQIPWFSRYRWVIAAAVIGIVAVAIWKIFLSPARIEVASVDRMQYPLPDNPSIAVLPFANMSGDPNQEFLCDGITEAIITALSRVPRMFVIARNSTFTYKGKLVTVKQVSEDLGVRYVIEGSFQRSGDRVRITVKLVDALKGHHLWAERYERNLEDLFALQDEITVKILSAVQMKLIRMGDVSIAERYAEKYYKGKQGLDCYLKLIQAVHYQGRGSIPDTNTARRLTEEAIALCPENPQGYIQLGWVYHSDYWLGNTTSRRETLEKGIELAQKALAMDDTLPGPHGLLSMLYRHKGEISESLAEGERAIALNPNDPIILENYGNSLLYAGRSEEAIPIFQKAIRIDPFFGFGHMGYGSALRLSGRFEEASSAYRRAMQFQPDNFLIRVYLAITCIMTDREKDARGEAAEVLRINPKYPDDFVAKNPAYKNQTESDKIDNVLRKGMAFFLFDYGNNLIFAGRTEEAIPIFEKLIRLNPFGPWYLYSQFGVALRNAERFGEAVVAHRKAIQLGPDEVSPRVNLAVTYILMGREREAQAEAAKVIRMNPKFTVDSWAKTFAYKDQSQQDKIVTAARKAGLKEARISERQAAR